MRQERKRKRKRFWLIVFSLFLLLAAGGYTAYRYTLNLAAEKISKTLANDHELMEKIRKEAGGMEEIQSQLPKEQTNSLPLSEQNSSTAQGADSPKEKQLKENAPSPSHKGNGQALSFANKQEAIQFVMGRFSLQEMNRFRQMASDGLTDREKQELKQIAFSRFTPQEIAAVLKALQ